MRLIFINVHRSRKKHLLQTKLERNKDSMVVIKLEGFKPGTKLTRKFNAWLSLP